MMKKKAAVGWSSGKDSALCLHALRQQGDVEVVSLFTTYNPSTQMVPIQGVPIAAVREQADSLGLPLIEIGLPEKASNAVYEKRLVETLFLRRLQFDHLAFGDLFLDGIKEYRENFLKPAGFSLLFPLMGQETRLLARTIIESGIRAKVVSVDRQQLEGGFCGREYDHSFLQALPRSVDPCGERGEFHSFVYQAPFFHKPLRIEFGETFSDERWTYLAIFAGR